MKLTTPFFALVLLCLAQPAFANLVWSESFSGYNAGDSVHNMTTSNNVLGSGTMTTNQNVVANSFGGITLTADGGRDAFQIDSSVAVLCGQFCFDAAFLGGDMDPDLFFYQMTQGGRSTSGNPIPGFNRTIDQDNGGGMSTDVLNMTRVNLFFNTSSQLMTYTAPDGSTDTINPGSFDFWYDSTRISDDATGTTNGTPAPSSISTFVMQAFNGQAGAVFALDNFELRSFDTEHAPEPGSFMLFAVAGAMMMQRRRKNA